jgi:hypothetical protein
MLCVALSLWGREMEWRTGGGGVRRGKMEMMMHDHRRNEDVGGAIFLGGRRGSRVLPIVYVPIPCPGSVIDSDILPNFFISMLRLLVVIVLFTLILFSPIYPPLPALSPSPFGDRPSSLFSANNGNCSPMTIIHTYREKTSKNFTGSGYSGTSLASSL